MPTFNSLFRNHSSFSKWQDTADAGKALEAPLGCRNRPVLVHGLPTTDCPRAWLLAAMNHEALPLSLRMACDVALLPYFHTRKG